MKHSEFIAKMAAAQAVVDYRREDPDKSYKAAANKFGITPMLAGSRVAFHERHLHDPRCEWLSDFQHKRVIALSSVLPLDGKASMRNALVDKFRATMTGAIKHWPKGIPKYMIRDILKASGLRWFELKGVPYVHWNEKKTETLR